MAPADTRGDDRTKPVWGTPPDRAAAAGQPSSKPSRAARDGAASPAADDRRARAEAAREARAQAKAARLEAKAEKARRKREASGAPARSRPAARRGPSAARATPAVAARSGKGQPATAKGATAKAASAGAATAKAKDSGAKAKAGGAKSAPAKARAATKGSARPPAPSGGGRRRPEPGSSRAKRARAFRQRYAVVHDLDGPRVRLGVCWFLLALAGIFGGRVPTALVYGGAAAIAAAQAARVWRKRQARPAEAMAAGGAGLITAGACLGAGGAGLGILGAVALAFVGAAGDTRSRNPRIADVGWTLQVALPPAVVGMSMVLLARLDQGSAVALLLLVSAYETGDFLIGSGASNPYEGPGAGAAAIVVVTFIISTLPISTLSFGQAWLLGGAVAVLAPAGQLLASALLPTATSPASALRRLDSLLIAAPLWAWAVGLFD
jgi:hypothetical protein